MKLEGIMIPLLTPLNSDDSLKKGVTSKVIEWQLNDGSDGFYVCGSTGEGTVLQSSVRMEMLEEVVDAVSGRKPVIAHVGASSLRSAIELARHAEKCGADYISSVKPFPFAYNENETYDYYKELSESVNLPFMIYCTPDSNMNAELVAKIFTLENVKAVKWTSFNYYEMMRLRIITQGKINVINGPDETLLCGLAAGADGGIGSTYNVMLPLYKKLYDAFKSGNMELARECQYKADKIITVLLKFGVIPTLKLMFSELGFDLGNSARPMRAFDNDTKTIILNELKNEGWYEL